MAQPIKFEEANGKRTAPPDMENCQDLHVFVNEEDGRQISCWELTGDELAEVLQTKRIWITIWGPHPPILIQGQTPFVEGS